MHVYFVLYKQCLHACILELTLSPLSLSLSLSLSLLVCRSQIAIVVKKGPFMIEREEYRLLSVFEIRFQGDK